MRRERKWPLVVVWKVNTDGRISFGAAIAGDYTPNLLPRVSPAFVAPFWADVDTTDTGRVYYRQMTTGADCEHSARPRTDSASAERNKIGRVVQSADKLMFCLCDIFSHFWRFCQTNYFNTYLTDLRQIFRFGTSMAAWMNDLKISFSLPQETFSWQTIL